MIPNFVLFNLININKLFQFVYYCRYQMYYFTFEYSIHNLFKGISIYLLYFALLIFIKLFNKMFIFKFYIIL